MIFKKRLSAGNQKLILRTYYSIIVVALLASIYKDITLAPAMPCDLRNRVVGARMLKDGYSPYFYIWKIGDPVRYYDLLLPQTTPVSRATASPFFHSLFGFVADRPQLQLDMLWIFIEYFSLACCCLLVLFAIPQNDRTKKMPFIAALTVGFTYTFGWRVHVWAGQNYIFIPLLIAGCFYCINNKQSWSSLFFFGIFAASLILIRPIAILFFLPFFFFANTFLKQGLVTLALLFIYCIFVVTNPVQKANWKDFFSAISTHVKMHQGIIETPGINYDCYPVKQFEGVDLETGTDKQSGDHLLKLAESSNLYSLYDSISKKKISITAMTAVGFTLVILVLLPLLWFVRKKINVPISSLFIIGFLVYNLYTFCSPIIKSNYYWVEFLFPLLLIIASMEKKYILPLALLITGLLLNVLIPAWIPARQNIGQLFILIALILQVYRPILISFLGETRWKLNNGMYWL